MKTFLPFLKKGQWGEGGESNLNVSEVNDYITLHELSLQPTYIKESSVI